MSEPTNPGRRRFLGTATTAFTAASLGLLPSARAQSSGATPASTKPGKGKPHTSFASLKQIDAGLLNVGYADVGPTDGPPVLLLHGWPYDIHSYVEVAPMLAAAGYRVIVPFVRGYGSTRFLSSDTVRNAQQSVVALDMIELLNALKIQKAIIGGFDWGARTTNILTALWPERCVGSVAVSGYLITNVEANRQPLPPAAEYGWWYQYYFATDRGQLGYDKNRHDFNKLIWQIMSPKWKFDDATYDRTAAAFDNPDHVAIAIHNYRWRLGLAKGEPKYDELEQKLFARPTIAVPTITIASDFDGPLADGKAYASMFSRRISHRILKGIGHNVPQEAPKAFAQAVIDVAHAST